VAYSVEIETLPVHPRGCGERFLCFILGLQAVGSSPRVRGTLFSNSLAFIVLRFIPAGAGNAGVTAFKSFFVAVHPRGCGERFSGSGFCVCLGGSSPRVRGTLLWSRYLTKC